MQLELTDVGKVEVVQGYCNSAVLNLLEVCQTVNMLDCVQSDAAHPVKNSTKELNPKPWQHHVYSVHKDDRLCLSGHSLIQLLHDRNPLIEVGVAVFGRTLSTSL